MYEASSSALESLTLTLSVSYNLMNIILIVIFKKGKESARQGRVMRWV